MPTIDVSDTTLYYERSGDGAAMIFVHCAFGDGPAGPGRHSGSVTATPSWAHDRRGYRRSSPGSAPVSYALHSDDAAALIEELDLARCLVVGLSSGAAIGLEVALRHSHLLRGAVLSEPPLCSLDRGAVGRSPGVPESSRRSLRAGHVRPSTPSCRSPARASGR
jgi:pimeloyl-ACP methyl ester carboxylesterase